MGDTTPIVKNGQQVGFFRGSLGAETDAGGDRHVTRLAFDQRFTSAERIGIDIASIDDPTAGMESRMRSAALRDMRSQVNNATFIDLDRPDTRAGVEQLEAVGMLAAGRAAEILDAPIQPGEAW